MFKVRNCVPYLDTTSAEPSITVDRCAPALSIADDGTDEGHSHMIPGFDIEPGGSLVVCPVASGGGIADEDQADPPLGISLRAGARDLRREALSINHLVTHVPTNPYCEACRVAKMQRRPHRRGGMRGVPREVPGRFGDEGTAGHIIVKVAHSQGIHGSRPALSSPTVPLVTGMFPAGG